MFDKSIWKVNIPDERTVLEISKSTSISLLCAKLLVNRGYDTAEKAVDFLYQPKAQLYNPYLLPDIKKAAERISYAIKKHEKIYIYGDYDVDGVTSVSLLYSYLKENRADVDYYIPSRDGEGYGISKNGLDFIKSRNCSLIITVDNGITAVEETEIAKNLGMDIIITDHHNCREILPKATAVINPKRPDSNYPFTELSGVAVVYKLVCAVEFELVNFGEFNKHTFDNMESRYLDITAIGTVADVMPLIDENRTIVARGLELLKKTDKIGIRSLIKACSGGYFTPEKINASYIGYTLAPKINAVGRISNAKYAVELFLSSAPSHADMCAEKLCEINKERQTIENVIYEEAIRKIDGIEHIKEKNVIVLSDDNWHPGVIGIVASRVTERYGLPCILISFAEGTGFGKGSARSIDGIDITKAFSHCHEYLEKYGGHALAGGLTISKEKLAGFSDELNEFIGTEKNEFTAKHIINIDAVATKSDFNFVTASQIALLEPFGASNPQPLLILKNASILEMTELSMGKHTKLCVESYEGTFDAICFGCNLSKNGFFKYDRVDIVFYLSINEYRGTKNLQLVIKDIYLSDSYIKELGNYFEADRIFKALSENDYSYGEIPIPEDFIMADVYKKIKKDVLDNNGEIISEDVIYRTGISHYVFRLALETFEQLGLIKSFRKNREDYDVVILPVKKKVSLSDAPIIKKIKAFNEKIENI